MQSQSTSAGVVRRDSMTVLGDYSKPENHIEIMLSSLWERLLSYDHVGLDDDYFALGGTSSQALEIFDQINNRYRSALPVSTLYMDTTIRKLAVRIRTDLNNIALTDHTTIPAGDLLPVCIASGPDPYLFVVPGLGGDPIGFEQIAKFVNGKRGIYGVQLPGVYTNERPCDDLRQMATRCISEICHISPDGPYYLLGKCAGGILALEIARQLRESGHEVVQVVMLNPPWVYVDLRLQPGSMREKIAMFYRMIRNQAFGFLREPLRMQLGYYRKKEKLNPYYISRRRVIYCFTRAVRNYEPQAYSLPVLIIGLPQFRDSRSYNWLKFLGKNAELYELNGDDTPDVMLGSNAEKLVELLAG
jgi:hypothetical protein